MFKRTKNEKGFTLIELLAVIVIMGVLMIVAIPMVTKYIDQSKRDAYVDTAKAYINAARYSFLNDEYNCTANYNGGTATYNILLEQIDVDNTNGKSSYSKPFNDASYVQVSVDAKGNAKYSICIVDGGNNGTTGVIAESALERASIKKSTGTCTKPTISLCTK